MLQLTHTQVDERFLLYRIHRVSQLLRRTPEDTCRSEIFSFHRLRIFRGKDALNQQIINPCQLLLFSSL